VRIKLLPEGEKRPLFLTLLAGGLLLLLLLVASYLRLRGLAYSPILGDQSILLNIAMHFVNTGELPLAANKSSAGIMNPPMVTYLLALPLFVERTLTAVHLFQGVLGITAVAIMAIYAQRLFGWRVALLATLLFALNPWAVYYSRFIWNPNPIPLFSTLLLMSLLAYFVGKQRPIHIIVAFFCFAVITQLYLSGLVLVAVLGIVLLFFWRRRPEDIWPQAIAPFVIGLAVFLLLYLPFMIFERATGFVDLQATMMALTSGTTSADGLGIGEVSLNMASFLLVEELATGNQAWFATGVPIKESALWTWAMQFGRFLFVASLLYVIVTPIAWRIRRAGKTNHLLQINRRGYGECREKKNMQIMGILALWIVVPILFYLRHTVYLQNYYFLYIYPAPFLAVAFMVDRAISRISAPKWGAKGGTGRSLIAHFVFIVPLLFFSFWQFNLYQTWFQLLDQGAIVPQRQTQYVEQAVDAVRLILAENEGCDLTILAEGGTLEGSSLSVIESFVYPTPVRYVDTQRGIIIPANCTVYMSVGESEATGWLAENGHLRAEQIAAGTETWRFYEVAGTVADNAPLVSWQNGLALLSVDIVGDIVPNGQLTLNYSWQVQESPPTGVRYHFFNHLLDGSGQIVAQEDAPAIDSLYWQSGDRLVTQFYLQLPPALENGRYTFLLGLYSWPDLERVPLTQSAETTYLVTTIEVTE